MHAAAEILGCARVAFLGYRDSGMEGETTNADEGCFATADIEEAANRLATILREEDAEVLTVYDENGNYGHPDHIQVHRVGHPRRRVGRDSARRTKPPSIAITCSNSWPRAPRKWRRSRARPIRKR